MTPSRPVSMISRIQRVCLLPAPTPGVQASAPARLRHAAVCLLLLSLPLVQPPKAAAQSTVASGVLGAGGGFVVGTYSMLAIYVTKARFGHFLFSFDEVLQIRPEILPLVAGPIAGAWVGVESSTALGRSVGWGSLGFLGGGAIGVGAGHLIWGTSEGRWAGGIIGSAIGLLGGVVLGAKDAFDEGEPGPTTTLFEFTIPLGGGGR